MIFSWWARRRRRHLRRQPFPAVWQTTLDRNVPYLRRLTAAEQAKLRDDIQVLVAEKYWEGCNGLEMTDEVRVTIAAQIGLLCLGFQEEYFEMVESILVYPDAYVAPSQTSLGGGVVLEGESSREGEAWYRGPVILSWDDVLEDGRRDHDGHNLVLHEFAHQLDMQGGRTVNGMPILSNDAARSHWQTVIDRQYRQLERHCRQGRPPVLDCYGTTNLAEFFAVTTEVFFERPRALHQHHAELFDLLADFYRQDPRPRFPT